MQAMTIQEIAAAVSGEWVNPQEGMASVASISTDSRNLEPGCLFVPWVGERFDGHTFIDKALDAGAAGCICAKLPEILRAI